MSPTPAPIGVPAMTMKILRASSTQTDPTEIGKTVALDQHASPALVVRVDVTAVTALETLNIRVQWSFDGSTWFDHPVVDAMKEISVVTDDVRLFSIKGPFVRIISELDGTSATFEVTALATSANSASHWSTHDQSTLVTTEYRFAVAQGDIPLNSYTFSFGHNFDIDSASVPEDVWPPGGPYTGFDAIAAETLSIVSDDANDTAAGTGMQSIKVSGLDANYEIISEEVTLNGLTPVLTTLAFFRVNSFRGTESGSSAANEGNVSATQSTSGIVMDFCEIGSSVAHNVQLTVPVDTRLYVQSFGLGVRAGGSASEVNLWIEQRFFGTNIWLRETEFQVVTGDHVTIDVGGTFIFPPKTDVRLRVGDVSNNNTQVNAWLSYLLEFEEE